MFTIEESDVRIWPVICMIQSLQDLISLKRQCELFLADFKKEEPCQLEVQDKLHQMNEQMSDVILMTRETCHELRPQPLYDLGLVKAVSKLAAQRAGACAVSYPSEYGPVYGGAGFGYATEFVPHYSGISFERHEAFTGE